MRFALASIAGIAMSMSVYGATLDKSFAPASIGAGGVSVLTFVVDNPAGAGGLTDVGFVDTLPSGLRVAAAPNKGGTCAGAAAATTAAAGGSTITVASLQVPAGPITCTVTVDVTNAAGRFNPSCGGNPAAFTNGPGNVTVSNIANGVQSSCLVVEPPTLAKGFSPTAIADGGVTVLTFVVANPAGAGALTDVGFADALPSGLRVAGAPNVGGTCANAAAATNASPGGSTITVANLQVPPGAASCTVTVDVTNAAGKLNPNCERRPDGFTNRRSNVTVANVVNDVSASCVTVGPVGPPVVNAPAPVPALHGLLLLLLGALLGAIGARARSRP